MNEKIRSILHTAWNEPRHFFFWLAMFGICGYVVIAAAVEITGATLPLAFVALGFILCFFASIPAYILAWIPPIRRLFAWLLRRRLLALCGVITFVALFYAVENWRGQRAWQNFKRESEAKGERFDLAKFIPPPVPNDQNFFETPLWQDLHSVDTNGTAAPRSDSKSGYRAPFNVFGPGSGDAPSTGNWLKAQRVDWTAWQSFYRGTNNLFPAQSGPPTNYFPIAKDPQSPVADVLQALSRFNENRQLLLTSASRPQSRFWINYDEGFAMLLPHLARIKATVQYLSLHANASLAADDTQTALEDLKLIFRLTDSIRAEPTLISHLVHLASVQLAMDPLWAGLADRKWTEADLRELESQLGELDFLADYQLAMRGERACDLWTVDYLRKMGISGLEELMPSDREHPGSPGLGRLLGMAMFRLVPHGWFDQNKLSLCRRHESYTLPAVDAAQRIVRPAFVEQSQAAIESMRRSPYDVLSKMLLPGVAKSARRFARAQTSVDQARVACALERYRLANGQYPETLEALAPKFVAALPHDLINGQPLKYHRTENGRFILYSVGWNETDDGGKVALNKRGTPEVDQGDWSWRYPDPS
jgi:hypothetical protein